jgi:hypothetical protein
VSPSTELSQFTSQLQTDRLTQTTYNRLTPQGPREITVYMAYWPAGQTPVSFVAAHTPDACWPSGGWTSKPVDHPRVPLSIGGRSLDDAEYRQFTQSGTLQHVWYWHLYAGRVIRPEGVRSPRQLLLLAFKYGFHHNGEQLFVRVFQQPTVGHHRERTALAGNLCTARQVGSLVAHALPSHRAGKTHVGLARSAFCTGLARLVGSVKLA